MVAKNEETAENELWFALGSPALRLFCKGCPCHVFLLAVFFVPGDEKHTGDHKKLWVAGGSGLPSTLSALELQRLKDWRDVDNL